MRSSRCRLWAGIEGDSCLSLACLLRVSECLFVAFGVPVWREVLLCGNPVFHRVERACWG